MEANKLLTGREDLNPNPRRSNLLAQRSVVMFDHTQFLRLHMLLEQMGGYPHHSKSAEEYPLRDLPDAVSRSSARGGTCLSYRYSVTTLMSSLRSPRR